MKNTNLMRLLLATGLAVGSGLAAAQGTTPGTTPTNPAPETMGTPQSGPSSTMSAGSMSSADGMPTKAECDKMMADHKKGGSSMAMDDGMKMKMTQCHDMMKAKGAVKGDNSMSPK